MCKCTWLRPNGYMGEMANKEVFDWLRQDPKIVRASSNIIRLLDDLPSHKVTMKQHFFITLIECQPCKDKGCVWFMESTKERKKIQKKITLLCLVV